MLDLSHVGYLRRRANQIDFTTLPRLRKVHATWRPTLDGVFRSSSVEELMLLKPPEDVFAEIEGMQRLRTLDVRDAPKVTSIPTLDNPPPLRSLTVALARRLEHLDGLTSYRDLETLELDDVAGLRDLSVISNLARLRQLVLQDCGEMETLSFLHNLPLEEVHITGTTNILDGDIRSIGTRLRKVQIRHRSHYNAGAEDLR